MTKRRRARRTALGLRTKSRGLRGSLLEQQLVAFEGQVVVRHPASLVAVLQASVIRGSSLGRFELARALLVLRPGLRALLLVGHLGLVGFALLLHAFASFFGFALLMRASRAAR